MWLSFPSSFTSTSRCQFHQYFTRNFLVRMCFSLLTFGFVIFWQKDISVKASRKMLMKLITGALGSQGRFLQPALRSCKGFRVPDEVKSNRKTSHHKSRPQNVVNKLGQMEHRNWRGTWFRCWRTHYGRLRASSLEHCRQQCQSLIINAERNLKVEKT